MQMNQQIRLSTQWSAHNLFPCHEDNHFTCVVNAKLGNANEIIQPADGMGVVDAFHTYFQYSQYSQYSPIHKASIIIHHVFRTQKFVGKSLVSNES